MRVWVSPIVIVVCRWSTNLNVIFVIFDIFRIVIFWEVFPEDKMSNFHGLYQFQVQNKLAMGTRLF